MSLFAPTNMSPQNIGVIAATPLTFEWTYNGTDPQTDYQLKIYELDNTLAYDSTKISSSDNFHTLASTPLDNGEFYKWQIETFCGVDSVNSGWVIFKTNSPPIVTPDYLPNPFIYQNYTFTANYSQSEGVPLKSFKFILYDSDFNTLFDTGDIYDTTISYEITGLSNYTSYYIECVVTAQNDMTATTGQLPFSTEYTIPDSSPILEITLSNEEGTIRSDWGNVIQILGSITGNYSFVEEFYECLDTEEDFEAGYYSENVEVLETGGIQFTYSLNTWDNFVGRTWNDLL